MRLLVMVSDITCMLTCIVPYTLISRLAISKLPWYAENESNFLFSNESKGPTQPLCTPHTHYQGTVIAPLPHGTQ